MPRDPVPTWFFVVVVVRDANGRFLVVHEAKHGQLWYLPAGRVEPGETFELAAVRETLEETGVPVQLEGVLRVEHTPYGNGARLRVIYVARPAGDTPPKSAPDEHTLEARWVTLDELVNLPLRGFEMVNLFAHVAQGGTIYPLSLVTAEGMPFDDGDAV